MDMLYVVVFFFLLLLRQVQFAMHAFTHSFGFGFLKKKKNSWREKQAWLARQPFRHGAVGATERLTFAANAKSQVCLKHLAPLM